MGRGSPQGNLVVSRRSYECLWVGSLETRLSPFSLSFSVRIESLPLPPSLFI